MRGIYTKLAVEALGKEETIVGRQHAILERSLIVSLGQTPAFMSCEEEEKMKNKQQRCTRT